MPPKIYTEDTILLNVSNLDGFYRNCILSGSISPSPGADVVFKDCASGHHGLESPVLDMSGSNGSNVSFRSYSGGITYAGVTDSTFTSTLEFVAGRLTVSGSSTTGFISVRGIGALIDSGSMTLETSSLINADSFNGIQAVPDANLSSRVQEIWQMHGLDITNPLKVTQTERTFAAVSQSINTVGTGSAQETTITRTT